MIPFISRSLYYAINYIYTALRADNMATVDS